MGLFATSMTLAILSHFEKVFINHTLLYWLLMSILDFTAANKKKPVLKKYDLFG